MILEGDTYLIFDNILAGHNIKTHIFIFPPRIFIMGRIETDNGGKSLLLLSQKCHSKSFWIMSLVAKLWLILGNRLFEKLTPGHFLGLPQSSELSYSHDL